MEAEHLHVIVHFPVCQYKLTFVTMGMFNDYFPCCAIRSLRICLYYWASVYHINLLIQSSLSFQRVLQTKASCQKDNRNCLSEPQHLLFELFFGMFWFAESHRSLDQIPRDLLEPANNFLPHSSNLQANILTPPFLSVCNRYLLYRVTSENK